MRKILQRRLRFLEVKIELYKRENGICIRQIFITAFQEEVIPVQ